MKYRRKKVSFEGGFLIIHPYPFFYVNHSFENQSQKSRHAYSLHVVDTVGCKWAPENW